jgi:UDP-3-O-[3-hydroxymyristoyl] N-acetylglucosamine deacetylase
MRTMPQDLPPSPRQRTVRSVVSISGRGLHTGRRVRMTLHPAAPDSGVLFMRGDLTDRAGAPVTIPATWRQARKMLRCSGLCHPEGHLVRTCEHLLTALYACGIDNVVVELDGEEVPIFDGSAAPLVEFVDSAGAGEQDAPRRLLRVRKAVESRVGERFVRLEPADEPCIELALTLRGFGRIGWSGRLDPETFRREIAWARTFAPLRHALPAKLWSLLSGAKAGRGLSLGNVIVHSHGRVFNPGGLRAPDEMARHRVLDVLGDLLLAGAPVLGKITAFRSAHSLNQDLVRALMEDAEAWSLE